MAGLLTLSAAAQYLTLPPNTTPPAGSTFNTITVNASGGLNATGLTVRPGGGQTGIFVTATSPSEAVATLTQTTINLGSGGGVKGIVVSGSGAVLVLGAGSSVLSSPGGGGNVGITVSNGGRVFLSDGAFVNMAGGGGSAQVVANGAGFFTMTGGSLTVSGGGGNGLRAGDDSTRGTVDLTGTQVTVLGSGGNSAGLWANISGSKASLAQGSISVSGQGGGNFGAKASRGAELALAGSSVLVDATGGNNYGLLITDANSTGLLVGSSVLVTQSNASLGVQVSGSQASLTSIASEIAVTGPNGTGAKAENGAALNLSGTKVRVDGSDSTGLHLNNSATALMSGGSVETTGDRGQAILSTGSATNTATFDGTLVSSARGTGLVARDGGSGTFTFQNKASLTGGNGFLLQNQTYNGSSIITLNAIDEVTLGGDIDATGSNGRTIINLTGASTLTGAINRNNLTGASGLEPAEIFTSLPKQNVNVSVRSLSAWQMRASSTVDTLEIGPLSQVNFAPSSPGGPFKTLLTNRLLGGEGTFGMNVDLGAIRGDLIHILQSSEGGHLLNITNVNQGSDLPVGRALLLVRTPDGGASFTGLAEGGVYKYFVVHGDGSEVTPVANDWYLVRAKDIDPDNPDPLDPDEPRDPVRREIARLVRNTLRAVLRSRVEELTNSANAAIGTYTSTFPMYYADMGTLVERLGELRLIERETHRSIALSGLSKGDDKSPVPPSPASPASADLSVWTRGFGHDEHVDGDQSRPFQQRLGGFQIGADRCFHTSIGAIYTGGFLGYFHAARDFEDGADGDTDALTAGLYGTWIHPKGWYADLVIKHTYLWNEFSTPTLLGSRPNVKGDYSIPTLGGSLELGKRWDFGAFFVEPQAQLEGAWAEGADYRASSGLQVQGDDQFSLRGRLGLRAGLHFELSSGQIFEPYAKVSVVNEFLGGDEIALNDQATFRPSLTGASLQAAGGLTARLSRSLFFYAEYDWASSEKLRTPWAIEAGLRYQW